MTTTENWFSEFSEIILSQNTEKTRTFYEKKNIFPNFGKADDMPFIHICGSKAIENSRYIEKLRINYSWNNDIVVSAKKNYLKKKTDSTIASQQNRKNYATFTSMKTVAHAKIKCV